MESIPLYKAKAQLSRLIRQVMRGKDVTILRGNKPVAKLVMAEELRLSRKAGSAKGQVSISEDFDAPLDDFTPYMGGG